LGRRLSDEIVFNVINEGLTVENLEKEMGKATEVSKILELTCPICTQSA
jgi:hypothetical protein